MLSYIISSLEVSHSSCAKGIELCLEISDSIPKPLQRIQGPAIQKTSWDSGYGPIIIPAIDEVTVVLLSKFEKFVNLKKKGEFAPF